MAYLSAHMFVEEIAHTRVSYPKMSQLVVGLWYHIYTLILYNMVPIEIKELYLYPCFRTP